jgi:tRNA pseudouridine38-40 synthase
MPADIILLRLEEVSPTFHAIRDAYRKRYRYLIADGGIATPWERLFAWQLWQKLDDDAMRQAAAFLVGNHDFASFETSGSERASTVRTVFELTVERTAAWPPFTPPTGNDQRQLLSVEIEADGFLYNMVRNIVGTLVEVGRGAKPVSWVKDALAAHDRSAAGPTAPAQGLFLLHVEYPSEGSLTHHVCE